MRSVRSQQRDECLRSDEASLAGAETESASRLHCPSSFSTDDCTASGAPSRSSFESLESITFGGDLGCNGDCLLTLVEGIDLSLELRRILAIMPLMLEEQRVFAPTAELSHGGGVS